MAQKAFSISQTPPYTIPAELYDEAYRLYQRKYLLWKNWLLEGILTLLTVDFIVTAVKDPSNGLTYFLMVLCVVLLALLIFHPLRIRRRVMDAVKEMGELPYVAALSEQEIVIQTLTEGEQGEEIPPTVLEYDEKMQIWEAEPFFLICEGKERFYVLPKKALYDEQIFAMRRFCGRSWESDSIRIFNQTVSRETIECLPNVQGICRIENRLDHLCGAQKQKVF